MRPSTSLLTLGILFFTAMGQAAVSKMDLQCQGTVARNLSFEAHLETSGEGELVLGGKSHPVTLVSKPSYISWNYVFSTPRLRNQDVYSLAVNPRLLSNKWKGATKNIKLFVRPALENHEYVYSLDCIIDAQ